MRIGIDLGGTKIEGVLLSDDGTIENKIRKITPGNNYLEIVEQVCELVDSLQANSNPRYTVGVGTPGTLSAKDQTMKNCNSVCLNGMPLKHHIETRLGYEIRMENDANCFTLSEACYGSARNAGTVFGVILGTGTGGGLVINKQLLNGPNRITGEWGHNSIPQSVGDLIDDDRDCYCGRMNCIETVLSGHGLKQSHLEITGETLDASEIARLAVIGDPAAGESIQLYCRQLALCLATIVNVVDPDMIVLGGGLSQIDELYRLVPEMMKESVFTDNMLTQLSAPLFGDASGARGAACLWPIE